MNDTKTRLLYSRQEAATMLNISLSGLDKLIHTGELKSIPVGKRRRLIRPTDLDAFVNKDAKKARKPKRGAS